MKIYHGTIAAALPGILAEGILPRTGAGNWKRCPSQEERLTARREGVKVVTITQ